MLAVKTRRLSMSYPAFIRAPHPKTEIRPHRHTIRRVLKSDWVAQKKIHGHRAQIHVPATDDLRLIVYNRHGVPHKKPMQGVLAKEVRRIFKPKSGWTILDAEWHKPLDRLYVFDMLKFCDESLRDCSFLERWEMLPRLYRSDRIETLGLIRSLSDCIDVLEDEDPLIEGLVFRAGNTAGFHDTTIVRCRKA